MNFLKIKYFTIISVCLCLGIITETFNETNNETASVSYCWSPYESELLSNHTFMITRQLVRLVTYYIMPLIFVSAFYILIAKHLFQAKGAILIPMSSQSFSNELTNSKRNQLNSKSTTRTSSHNSSYKNGSHEQNRTNEMINGNCKGNFSKYSIGLDNEELMNIRDSSSTSSRTTSLPSSSSRTTSLLSTSTIKATRRKRDTLANGSSISNNNNNNQMNVQKFYRDVKLRKQLRARHKVAKTVLFLCSVFFICWLPKQIHDLYW